MNRDEAKQAIKESWETLITSITTPAKMKVNGRASYVCPLCGHGTHGDGLTFNNDPKRKDPYGLKCFGCNFSGDIISLYMQTNGTDYNTTLTDLAGQLGITLDKAGNFDKAIDEGWKQHRALKRQEPPIKEEPETDYTDFFLTAEKDLTGSPALEYLAKRGISEATARQFKLGYVKEWKHPKAETAPASPRLIIPTSNYSYLARDIRADLTEEQKHYSKQKVGKAQLFNADVITDANKPVFVVEGEIDAISITEAGGLAVGLGSTSNKDKFIDLAKQTATAQPFVLSLDNDDPGQKAEAELADLLTAAGISFYRHNIAISGKDANEALLADPEGFRAEIAKAEAEATDSQKQESNAEKEEYLRTSAAAYMQTFRNDIAESANAPVISTGFTCIDKLLDGGLYPGLYFIGAISSLGKTTFALQITDQIAQKGQDCLIFSLEMAKEELIAKSISRITYRKAVKTSDAKTTRGILDGTRYKDYTAEVKELIADAEAFYTNYASHVFIREAPIGGMSVKEIREEVARHVRITGNRPVILIDYLQILAPYNPKYTDKQNIDTAVNELKMLSRDYKTPVIGISSFNRDNYNQAANMAAYKESGAIEYSADTLIALQYTGLDDAKGEERDKIIKRAEEAGREGNAQSIQVKVLKQRNGTKGSTNLSFYPMFNYFSEAPAIAPPPLKTKKQDPFWDMRHE